MVIAFPGSDNAGSKPEIAVLASLLGGKSTIKWAPGFSLLSKATAGSPGLSVSATNLGYSDAGLLTIQLSGPAASVRKAAEETAKALKSIAAGTVSKEDLTKAIANAKFDALEKAQLRGPSMLLAGSSIVNSGKPSDLAALAKSIESVTADKLKTVSIRIFSAIDVKLRTLFCRLPRLSSTERRPSLLSVTCSCCHTPRTLVCEYKGGQQRRKKLVPTVKAVDVEVGDVFVNISSRTPFVHTAFPSPGRTPSIVTPMYAQRAMSSCHVQLHHGYFRLQGAVASAIPLCVTVLFEMMESLDDSAQQTLVMAQGTAEVIQMDLPSQVPRPTARLSLTSTVDPRYLLAFGSIEEVAWVKLPSQAAVPCCHTAAHWVGHERRCDSGSLCRLSARY